MTAVRQSEPVSFFDMPLDVKLAPFSEFDFGGVSSWPEIELYATVAGVDLDIDFLNALCALSYLFPNIYGILLTELAAPKGGFDALANSQGFVECVFKVWTRRSDLGCFASQPQREVERWLMDNGIQAEAWSVPEDESKRKKYFMLQALDNKFPYLLVKFYAAHSSDLRIDDGYFIIWLLERLAIKSKNDKKLVPVLDAVRKANSACNRTMMYMM